MSNDFQSLTAYNSFFIFLKRNKVKFARKLIGHIFLTYYDDLNLEIQERKTFILKAKSFFKEKSGFNEWIKRLETLGILRRVGHYDKSTFKIASIAKKYLLHAHNEVRVFISNGAHIKALKDLEKENKMLKDTLARYDEERAKDRELMKKIYLTLTKDQIEKVSHLTLVVDNEVK